MWMIFFCVFVVCEFNKILLILFWLTSSIFSIAHINYVPMEFSAKSLKPLVAHYLCRLCPYYWNVPFLRLVSRKFWLLTWFFWRRRNMPKSTFTLFLLNYVSMVSNRYSHFFRHTSSMNKLAFTEQREKKTQSRTRTSHWQFEMRWSCLQVWHSSIHRLTSNRSLFICNRWFIMNRYLLNFSYIGTKFR